MANRFQRVSGWTDSLRKLLKSKEAKDMAPFIPYGSAALMAFSKMDEVVSDAKQGDPAAIATVKEIKIRADSGDPAAKEAVAAMVVVSSAQKVKAKKNRGFYARGTQSVSVGHDPITFGAVRDQRGGAGGGGGVKVTSVQRGVLTPTGGGYSGGTIRTHGDKAGRWYPANFANPGNMPAIAVSTLPPQFKTPPQGDPNYVPPPTQGGIPVDPYADPYGQGTQMSPYGGYNPYGGYGGYPMPAPYDPYAQYGYGGFDPYSLGMPAGYGYEDPVVDRGGYQQYDEATNSFFSNNQKMVYDEDSGMFMPDVNQNPYW